jgi:glutamine amidotransferase
MTTSPLVAVIDYGFGNLRSVARAVVRAGLAPEVTSDPAAVRRADAVVLPGVGAFADAVASLRAKGLDDAVRAAIDAGRPYLGLCLGLQVLFEESEEHGPVPGWGVLRGRVARFSERTRRGERVRVPHIGWNQVRFRGSHPMLAGLPAEDTFYFVHSYHAVPGDSAQVVGTAEYPDGEPFAAAVATERLFAVQFHPEKSQWAGKRLLDSFAAWVSACR